MLVNPDQFQLSATLTQAQIESKWNDIIANFTKGLLYSDQSNEDDRMHQDKCSICLENY